MSSAHDLALIWRDGHTETIRAREDETVLAAAESAGVGLPFGCRTGACGTCAARLVDGTVAHVRPPRALRSPHVDAGYVLACVARPRTDCRLAVGADRQAELLAHPWK